jgi:hypothetical protein
MREVSLYMQMHGHRTVSGVIIPTVDHSRSLTMSDIDPATPAIQNDELEKHRNRSVFATVGGIASAMALGALAVALSVLNGELVLLGFCLAFAMMLFIGLPLMLASLMDAVETPAH